MPANIGDVFFAIDKSREEAAEYGALEDFYEKQEKRGFLQDLWSFATGLSGAIIGMSAGPAGMAKGWGYGTALGQTLAGYDHKMDALEDLNEMDPGKFNTAEDLTRIREMKSDVKDDYFNTLVSAGIGAGGTAIAAGDMIMDPELEDVWDDLTYSQKLTALGTPKEELYNLGGDDQGFFKSLSTAVSGATDKDTYAYDLAKFFTSNYALSSYLRGGNISEAVGQHLLYNMFPTMNPEDRA